MTGTVAITLRVIRPRRTGLVSWKETAAFARAFRLPERFKRSLLRI